MNRYTGLLPHPEHEGYTGLLPPPPEPKCKLFKVGRGKWSLIQPPRTNFIERKIMNNPYKTVSIEDARFKPNSSAPEAILRFDGCLQIQCNAPDGTPVGILIHQRGWREMVSELVTADDACVTFVADKPKVEVVGENTPDIGHG